jgi:hypothetical protein
VVLNNLSFVPALRTSSTQSGNHGEPEKHSVIVRAAEIKANCCELIFFSC